MSLQFETTHRLLIRVMRSSGLRLPWVRPQSTLSAVAYAGYDLLLVTIGCYQLIFSGSSIILIGNFQDMCNLVTIAVTLATGVMISIFYVIYQKRLEKCINDWNVMNMKLLNNELDQARNFKRSYLHVAQKNVNFAKRILFLVFWTPFIYCSPVPIIDAINQGYRTNLPLPILYPYDDRQPGIYELTFCLHVLGLVISVMKKIGNDCFFLSLFKMQSVYLRCLSASIKQVGQQFRNHGSHFIELKQTAWINFHAELIRNASELVSIYTPIIIIYYGNLIIIVVFGLFTQIKNDRDNVVQGFGIGGFALINIFQLYLMSSTAEDLTTEAERLAQEIYNVPWYRMKKADADRLRPMLLMARKPVQITAYRTPTFLLNKETFIGFVINALTALMTFTKINDLRQTRVPS